VVAGPKERNVQMKKIKVVICIATLMISQRVGLAASIPTFTGRYTHPAEGNRSDLDSVVILDVVQREETIEITRVFSGGKTSRNLYSLNGTEENCISLIDLSAKCKAQLKGRSLILETVVVSNDASKERQSLVHVRTVDKWQLSGDSKTITIRSYLDFPDNRSGNSSKYIEGQYSDTDRYVRQAQ
jgi:hypothetical protein